MEAKIWLKIGTILFFIGLILIFISWIFTYPIYISKTNENSFTQFYPILWPGLVISLLGLFTILYYVKSKSIGALCCSLFPLFLYIPAFFFSYIPSSDCGFVRGSFQVFQKTGIDKNVIPYFEFPNYFTLNEIIHQIAGLNEKGIALISFVVYGVLLGLFLYLFFFNAKKEQNIQLIPFLLVFVYFIGMFSFLNYQWVPQTLALVYFFLLIFISTYMFSNSIKIEWKFIFILLFIPFVFTHAFLPVIFLIFFSILTIKKRYLLQILLVITSFYLIVTIYYTAIHFHLYVVTFEQSIRGFGGEYIYNISRSFAEASDLTDQVISFSNRIRVPMVWIISSMGTIILFFKKKINYLLISLGFAGFIYMGFGIFYSVLGLRATQILFIPLTVGFMFFISKWKKPTVVLIIIILILSVSGSMRIAYNNTHFQTDEEANACNFLANKIINETNPKVAIGQVNWGYFTSKYEYINNTLLSDFAVRPGSFGFLDIFNGSLEQNEYIFYNSNLGKEIMIYLMTEEDFIKKFESVTYNNNKIYNSGTTFILNGKII
ncbi:MAG: hypothetical protein QHH15_01130 [Candidatus Thermoplasmatota archaeon]|jgi:hypothetical protein|nr:hypothetical protein [Candidatus Thermoplasmatota archaeon]